MNNGNKFHQSTLCKRYNYFYFTRRYRSVLVALPTGTGVNIAGFFMIFAGIITALILKSGYKNAETGESYKKKEYYFQQEMDSVIASALESKPNSIDLTQADKGNAIKLDVYYSNKSGKANNQE